MQIYQMEQFIDEYPAYKEPTLNHRFFKHKDVMAIIERLPSIFEVSEIGNSLEGHALKLIHVGKGPTKVFLWSQMHGNEPTGTMALMDLLGFFQTGTDEVSETLNKCSIYMLPMVNPDGAERHSRRNAQQLDINRDYLQTRTVEAALLKATHDRIKPDFGFNLHDQSDLWSVTGTRNPAALSFLAPAFDEELNLNSNRTNAMLVIADIYSELKELLIDKIGLFHDTYEPRAFGDNFQASGTATILIEGGRLIGDQDSQEVRKMVFKSILKGLNSIASGTYFLQKVEAYQAIPKNTKGLFHILIREIQITGVITSIGVNCKSYPNQSGTALEHFYTIDDLGDLSTMHAYEVYDGEDLIISGDVHFDKPAEFDLLQGSQTILSFRKGILQPKQ
jgi:hypothetical protein